jgi:hypothetical protein
MACIPHPVAPAIGIDDLAFGFLAAAVALTIIVIAYRLLGARRWRYPPDTRTPN